MKQTLTVAAILVAFVIGMAVCHRAAKEAELKAASTPPVDRKLAVTEDVRRIHRNELHLHLIYRCQTNWLGAHPQRTLPDNSDEACTNTDEIVTKWNEANE